MSREIVVKKGTSWIMLLGILFVGLKLAGIINWSWWWVTLPFWGELAAAFVIIVFILILTVVAHLLE